jgi:hypothetical protein
MGEGWMSLMGEWAGCVKLHNLPISHIGPAIKHRQISALEMHGSAAHWSPSEFGVAGQGVIRSPETRTCGISVISLGTVFAPT